jgi:hypothetical protein
VKKYQVKNVWIWGVVFIMCALPSCTSPLPKPGTSIGVVFPRIFGSHGRTTQESSTAFSHLKTQLSWGFALGDTKKAATGIGIQYPNFTGSGEVVYWPILNPTRLAKCHRLLIPNLISSNIRSWKPKLSLLLK